MSPAVCLCVTSIRVLTFSSGGIHGVITDSASWYEAKLLFQFRNHGAEAERQLSEAVSVQGLISGRVRKATSLKQPECDWNLQRGAVMAA